MGDGMGSHQSHRMLKDEWLTPPEIVRELGPFDLDPCAPVKRPWDTADDHYTIEDDGLSKLWDGYVWCNPPYGKHTEAWLTKLADHGNGIALIFARTETKMFFNAVWDRADAVLFLRGRLHFHHVDGTRAVTNAGAPSCLVAYGSEPAERLATSEIGGVFFQLPDGRIDTMSKKRREEPVTAIPGVKRLRRTARRKVGLLFPQLRVEVQTVTKAHKQTCFRCTEVPEGRRLHIVRGSGRHQKQQVYCMVCGLKVLKTLGTEVRRAQRFLATGKGEIRL